MPFVSISPVGADRAARGGAAEGIPRTISRIERIDRAIAAVAARGSPALLPSGEIAVCPAAAPAIIRAPWIERVTTLLRACGGKVEERSGGYGGEVQAAWFDAFVFSLLLWCKRDCSRASSQHSGPIREPRFVAVRTRNATGSVAILFFFPLLRVLYKYLFLHKDRAIEA